MSERRLNRKKAAAVSGAMGTTALVVAALVIVSGTSVAIPLAIAALTAFIYHGRRALTFAGLHLRHSARHAR